MKYKTQGTCSQEIDVELKDGVIDSVSFLGGCNGNLQGISALVKGMTPQDAIGRLKGIRCGMKPTSCPDQLANFSLHCFSILLFVEAILSASFIIFWYSSPRKTRRKMLRTMQVSIRADITFSSKNTSNMRHLFSQMFVVFYCT